MWSGVPLLSPNSCCVLQLLRRPSPAARFRHGAGQPVAHTGFGAMMVLDGCPALDRTCMKRALGCHWKMKLKARSFWPLGLWATYLAHAAGPWTVSSTVPLCRKLMILDWLSPTSPTACAKTSPAEYASATSALMSETVPPYLAMYSCTITWLSAFWKPPYQPFGTMIPLALLRPIALRKFWPWSGPAAAISICGLKPRRLNSLMNADTVGTSTEPMRTTCGCCAATLSASAASAACEESAGYGWLSLL